jgi:hypothetical protein
LRSPESETGVGESLRPALDLSLRSKQEEEPWTKQQHTPSRSKSGVREWEGMTGPSSVDGVGVGLQQTLHLLYVVTQRGVHELCAGGGSRGV